MGLESNGIYWRPMFCQLEDNMKCWLVNGRAPVHIPQTQDLTSGGTLPPDVGVALRLEVAKGVGMKRVGAIVVAGFTLAMYLVVVESPEALATPPTSCAAGQQQGNVEVNDKEVNHPYKTAVHTYLWSPGGTGSECLRVNSQMMGADNVLEFPYVEFGWKIGWSTFAGTTVYTTTPMAFMTWDSNNTGFVDKDTDSTGSRYYLTANSWQWFTISSNGDGTWTTSTTGPNTFRTSLNLGFSQGYPVVMNAERHCSSGNCDNTSNYGNFDRIKVRISGVWDALADPGAYQTPDLNYHSVEDTTTSNGNHWRSDCNSTVRPCPNTL